MNAEKLIGVIDIKSHCVKFAVLGNTNGNILYESAQPINIIKPNPGWVEVDAEQIWNSLRTAIDEVIEQLKTNNLTKDDIAVIGITNEKDTILAWDSVTNKPLHNAIHYTDTRTEAMIQDSKTQNPSVFYTIENNTGLRVTSMSSGIKFKWIIKNVNNVGRLIATKSIKFGTLDTWLVWKLTKGKVFVTDVTNASYTLLMDLKTLQWSPKYCKVFNVPISLLPKIVSSSQDCGIIEDTELNGLLIGSIFANHQAASYGLNYTRAGQILSRYDESCTVFCIAGTEYIKSNNGLITTVAYQIDNEPVVYALEGWTSIGGQVLEWLKSNMKIMSSDEEIKLLDVEASDVYFVPAFNGLAAPHWIPEARGIICGITHYTNKNHIIRAALESLCFSTKDICIAFKQDTGIAPSELIVDGQYSIYNNLLSYQADILGRDVIRSRMIDMAVFGSAKAAARVINIEFKNHQLTEQTSKPTTTYGERKFRYSKWRKAIVLSIETSETDQVKQKLWNYDLTKIVSVGYLLAMMGIMVISETY